MKENPQVTSDGKRCGTTHTGPSLLKQRKMCMAAPACIKTWLTQEASYGYSLGEENSVVVSGKEMLPVWPF